jgi:hypothetical protein
LFGLPPQTSLVISLAKRVRELSLGLPGLGVWQLVEGQSMLRRRRQLSAASDRRVGDG